MPISLPTVIPLDLEPVMIPMAPTAPARPPHTAHTTPTYLRGLMAIRGALCEMLDAAPAARAAALYEAVCSGEIDGSTYEGHCRCVIGWLAITPNKVNRLALSAGGYMVEAFVYHIPAGQTPETNGRLRRLRAWIEAWMVEQIRKDDRAGMDGKTCQEGGAE